MGRISATLLDPEKIAGIGLPDAEPFVEDKDILDGKHSPRAEVLYCGEQLITEVYEDHAAKLRFDTPFEFDEFITILEGKLILTNEDGTSQEFNAGDSLVLHKGFSGIWEMVGKFRELVVIERKAYEATFGPLS